MTTTVQGKKTVKRAADFTGKLTEKLQEEKRVELLEASQRMAIVTSQAAEAKNDVVDYTDSDEPLPQAVLKEVEVSTPYRMIRVNQDINQMVYGRDVLDAGDYDNPDLSKRRPAVMGPMKFYDFAEGQLYRVTKDLAEHLNDKGYVSYMSGA